MAEELTESRIINAPAAELYEVAADLAAYPEWAEGAKAVDILEADADGLPLRATMVVDAQIREATYTLAYEHDAPNRMAWVSEPGGDVKHIEGSYTFTEVEGGTEVVYHLKVDLGFPVPGFVVRKATQHVMRLALDGLAEQCDASAI